MQDFGQGNPVLFGISIIEQFLPHRFPFLFIESVQSYDPGDTPILSATYNIKSNGSGLYNKESYMYWPSIYIVEGLGQCCNLLAIITAIERWIKNNGSSGKDSANIFQNSDERIKTLIASNYKKLLSRVSQETIASVGLLGSVDIEIVDQVKLGQQIKFDVQQTYVYNSLLHFKASASVDDRIVAKGVLIGASDLVNMDFFITDD